MKEEIIARLTIPNHEELTDKEIKILRKWLREVIPQIATYKRGEISKNFKANLFK